MECISIGWTAAFNKLMSGNHFLNAFMIKKPIMVVKSRQFCMGDLGISFVRQGNGR
jgi:hypothetical protein